MILARSFWLVKLLSRPKEPRYNQKQLSIFSAKCFITKCYKLSRECRKSNLSNINKATLYSKLLATRKAGQKFQTRGIYQRTLLGPLLMPSSWKSLGPLPLCGLISNWSGLMPRLLKPATTMTNFKNCSTNIFTTSIKY